MSSLVNISAAQGASAKSRHRKPPFEGMVCIPVRTFLMGSTITYRKIAGSFCHETASGLTARGPQCTLSRLSRTALCDSRVRRSEEYPGAKP